MQVFDMIRQGAWQTGLMILLARAFVLFCTLPAHEAAHGLVAYRLGDPTAKEKGRLTLNPLKHLDPIGSIMIMVFGFGWAKPVPVNMQRFKKPKLGMAVTAAAGPLSNLIMGFIACFFYSATRFLSLKLYGGGSALELPAVFFQFAAIVNIQLAVFNLIPIPPLDGSRLLNAALPDKLYYKLLRYERVIQFVLIAAVFLGFLNKPLAFLSEKAVNFMGSAAALPFRPFL